MINIRYLDIAEKELKRKYIYEKMTIRKCAIYFNCSLGTINKRLVKYNISIRNMNEANKGQKAWNKGKTGLQVSWLKDTKGLIGANKGSFKKGQFTGEKHPMWKGGITPLNKWIRASDRYKEWRLMILGRDNFTCQDCGKRGIYLHAHHKKSLSFLVQYYKITSIDEALKCEGLFDINNGVTLCKKCHRRYHKDVGFFKDRETIR